MEALEKSLPTSGWALGIYLVKCFFLLNVDYPASRHGGLCLIHSLPVHGHHGDSHVRDKETHLRMLSNWFEVSWLSSQRPHSAWPQRPAAQTPHSPASPHPPTSVPKSREGMGQEQELSERSHSYKHPPGPCSV